MNKMGWLGKKIQKIVEFVGSVVLVAITVLTISQVLSRYVFKSSLLFWSEEFIRFLFIWLIWLGAVVGIPKGEHMVILYFQNLFFKGKTLLVIRALVRVFAVIFLSVLVVKGWSLAQAMSKEYYTTFPVPITFAYLPSVVCGTLMLYYLCLEIWTIWKELLVSGRNN